MVPPTSRAQLRHLAGRVLSRFENVAELRSVCLMLGPYRNLTTLAASITALHQNCQVLNHAGEEIFGDPRLNFFEAYTPAKFRAFVRFALWASERGTGGQGGGSIVHSHAFRRPAMRHAYEERYGRARRKERTHSLVWKESLRTSNLLKRGNVDLDAILQQNPMLRFLMPVRYPLDCARSNLKSGHVKLFPQLQADAGEREVLDAILEEIRWFMAWHERRPDRFFYFYQHRFGRDQLRDLARFLQLSPDETWIDAALGAYVLEDSYAHPDELRDHYAERVRQVFADRPAVMTALLELNRPGQRTAEATVRAG
ncbi:MAG TPA: hypothetical protein VK933_17300 [Longimicrobiales bacterium]|nr:hypothetical protein [Longimicrobiales bacterium]